MGFRKQVALLIAVCSGAGICLAQDSTRRLQEVEVKEKKESNFGHLNQVDGMKITAGKKTEVIRVDQLTVNKATNNTRQVYAKVAGLNIFENDGSGLQLSIGGRGLDPNRTANFNVRQNGYDISADALGYPESYYTPPAEALKKIEFIRGAAGLQFGPQFGGLVNFVMKQPEDRTKPIVVESRQTLGSWGFLSSFNSIGGTKGKLSYYTYVHYKKGDGWRPNGRFESLNAYADLHYHISDRHMLGIEYSHLQYLAQQPGGLDDKMFAADARQSNRPRNWFAVNWDLLDLEWSYHISDRTKLQTRAFGLLASRKAIGFRPNRPSQPDNGGMRDLLRGSFSNLTLESRLLHRYTLGKKEMNLLAGVRAYHGYSTGLQADVNNGSGADFNYEPETSLLKSDYTFPNYNLAAFAEQIIRINDKWNITPGIRVEYIRTQSSGVYHSRVFDLRDSVISDIAVNETRVRPRTFLLGALGSSYKFSPTLEAYGNISQNYRSVTFTDMQVVNPSFQIDPAISDEKGWSADLGARGSIRELFRFDGNLFYLYYGNRIGEYNTAVGNQVIRKRANVGVAQIYGLETFMELDALKLAKHTSEVWHLTLYSNLTLTQSEYTKSPLPDVAGKEVEYVPFMNWKAGVQAGYRKFRLTWQFSKLSDQYADATNASGFFYSAVNGLVPAYQLMDLSASWSRKWLTIEASVNNLANVSYFTRRATAYPGPGIIPGEGRSFYLTIGINTL